MEIHVKFKDSDPRGLGCPAGLAIFAFQFDSGSGLESPKFFVVLCIVVNSGSRVGNGFPAPFATVVLAVRFRPETPLNSVIYNSPNLLKKCRPLMPSQGGEYSLVGRRDLGGSSNSHF